MEPILREAIERIHSTGTRCVIYVAGGGSQGVSWLLGVRGASHTILDARIPYSHAAFRDALSIKTWRGSHCSQEAAREMAKAAYMKGVRLSNAGEAVVGLAATAVLESQRERRGGRRAFVAAEMSWGAVGYELMLGGTSERWAEDALVGKLLVQGLYDCVVKKIHNKGQDSQMELMRNALSERDVLKRPVVHERTDIREALIQGALPLAEYYMKRFEVSATRGNLFLPGSFNPLHVGHTELLRAAAEIRGSDAKPCYELSAMNVDKPPLSRKELSRRLQQFDNSPFPIVVTSVPRFDYKAALLPGSTFVIGIDTLVRLLMPKYYGDSGQRMHEALLSIVRCDCNFLVAGRKTKDSDGEERYLTLSDIDVPPYLRNVFRPIPQDTFRRDISSTELRERGVEF